MKMPLEVLPVPKKALSLLRWLMLISWTLFPIADTTLRLDWVTTEQAEHLFCGADYAAKVCDDARLPRRNWSRCGWSSCQRRAVDARGALHGGSSFLFPPRLGSPLF